MVSPLDRLESLVADWQREWIDASPARLIILTAVATVPFLIPRWLELRTLPLDIAIPLTMWIVPAAIAAALPFTFGFSTDGIRRRARPASRVALT